VADGFGELDPSAEPDNLVTQIQAAVGELGDPAAAGAIPLPELAETLGRLHTGLQSALTELDRA